MKKGEELTGKANQSMRAGEYQLHVLIEATSSLYLKQGSDVNAVISIEALGSKVLTKVKKGVGF